MKRKRLVYLAISLAVSFLLLGLLLSQIKIGELLQTLRRIYVPALCAYMAVSLFAAVLRALRYKWFLHPQKISWSNILLVTFVRNSLVDLLPARLGSLSFIYLMNKRLSFPFESATSAFVMALVFDFLTLGPFVILAVIAVGLGQTAVSTPALLLTAAVFFIIVILILWQIKFVFGFGIRLFRGVLRILKADQKRWAALSLEKLELTARYLDQMDGRRLAIPTFFLSLLIRLGKYISLYFLLYALLRSHGFSFATLSFWKLILGITGAELTSALPVKGIAGFGTWESAWALTFELLKFAPAVAIISGLGVHLLTNLFEYSLGIASLLILAWPFVRRNARAENDNKDGYDG